MVPTLRAHEREIAKGRFRARQHHHVCVARERCARRHEREVHRRLHAERIHVVEVCDSREHRRDDSDPPIAGSRSYRVACIEGHSVFRRQAARSLQPRNDPPARPSRVTDDRPDSAGEQTRIAPELVDRESGNHGRVVAVEHRLRSHDRGDDAAAIDVCQQADRCLRTAREPHVCDVAVPQVGLRGAPRPFHDHHVVRPGQALEALHHRREETIPARDVIRCSQRGGGPSVHHDLRRPVGLGLEQHRVHVDRRHNSGRSRLECLGPTDLAAVGTGRCVVRHVLRLERGDGQPPPAHRPAQPRDDGGLSGVGAGALDHQDAAPHAASGRVTGARLESCGSGRCERRRAGGPRPVRGFWWNAVATAIKAGLPFRSRGSGDRANVSRRFPRHNRTRRRSTGL